MPGGRRKHYRSNIIAEEKALVEGAVEEKEVFMLRVALHQAPGHFISVSSQAFQLARHQKARIDSAPHGLKISWFTKRSIDFIPNNFEWLKTILE